MVKITVGKSECLLLDSFLSISLFIYGCAESSLCAGFSLVAVSWGCSLAAESGLLIAMASLAVERGLQGTWASVVLT